jgi:hypothetical protein
MVDEPLVLGRRKLKPNRLEWSACELFFELNELLFPRQAYQLGYRARFPLGLGSPSRDLLLDVRQLLSRSLDGGSDAGIAFLVEAVEVLAINRQLFQGEQVRRQPNETLRSSDHSRELLVLHDEPGVFVVPFRRRQFPESKVREEQRKVAEMPLIRG